MENQKVNKVFRSRISVLLLCFLLVVFFACTIPMFINQMIISGLCIVGGTLVFVIFLLSGIRYIITSNKLFVKILWIIPRWSVNISNIISVKRSYNFLASPAASIKRLLLYATTEEAKFPVILISPVREQEFIEKLKAVNPYIYVHVPVPVKEGTRRVQDWDI